MQFLPAVESELTKTDNVAEKVGTDVVALVLDAQRGDVDAFGELLGQFERRVFHFVLRMLRNAHDAEDVTQDTFVKAWRHLASFRPRHSFSTWLFTIARRTALNHIRARRPTEELADHHEPSHGDSPDQTAEDREQAESVWEIARRLKPDQYEVIWLRYGEGFSVDETARIMNTNSIRVRVLLHRARKRMAEWLQHKNFTIGGAQ
ncbi:sigma-70 family RNA polymerase sigma factor [bacterium]|nr:sigma-70 family RNA polymerase sigma factor [bacterium]